MTVTKLLTTAEAAERLRCSEAKVKRLRLAGHLAYLPGRPVRIPESAVEEYIAGALVKEASASVVRKAAQHEAVRRATNPTQAEIEADARAWAAKVLLKRKLHAVKVAGN